MFNFKITVGKNKQQELLNDFKASGRYFPLESITFGRLFKLIEAAKKERLFFGDVRGRNGDYTVTFPNFKLHLKKKKGKYLQKQDHYYVTLHALSPKLKVLDRVHVIQHEKVEDQLQEGLLLQELFESINCLRAHVTEDRIDNEKDKLDKERHKQYRKDDMYQKYDNKNS